MPALTEADLTVRKMADRVKPPSAPNALFRVSVETINDLEVHRLKGGILVLIGPLPIAERRLRDVLHRAWEDIERVAL